MERIVARDKVVNFKIMAFGLQKMMRRTGVGFAALGLTIGLVAIVLAAAPFNAGIWSDTEPMIVGVFGAGAISALGMAIAAIGSPVAAAGLVQPTVIAAAGLAVWSLLAGFMAGHSELSLFGAPQLGEGAAFWAVFAVFSASASLVRATRYFRLLSVLLCAVTIVVALVNALAHVPIESVAAIAGSLRMFKYDEFQAYFAVACFGLAAIGHARRRERWLTLALVMAATVSVLASHNRTALVALVVAGFLMSAQGQAVLARLARRMYIVISLVAAVLLLPLAAEGLFDLRTIAPTLWARSELAQIVVTAVMQRPEAAVFGEGWGQYQERLTALVDLVRIEPPAGATGWHALLRDMFHSHNAVLEALISAGLPAAVLRIAIPIMIIVAAGRRSVVLPLVLAWCFLDALWFMLPCMLAPIALAMTAGVTRMRAPCAVHRQLAIAVAFATGVGLLLCAITLGRDIVRSNAIIACLPPNPPRADCAGTSDLADLRGNAIEIATVVKGTLGPAIGAGGTLDAGQRMRMRDLLTRAETRQEAGPTAVLGLALADAYAQIAWSDHGADLLPSPLAEVWARSLKATLDVAPRRIDATVPYLNWLVAAKRDRDIETLLVTLRARDPHHPVSLWFSGLQSLGSGDRTRERQGIADMRAALLGGLERIMPVDPTVRGRLLRGP